MALASGSAPSVRPPTASASRRQPVDRARISWPTRKWPSAVQAHLLAVDVEVGRLARRQRDLALLEGMGRAGARAGASRCIPIGSAGADRSSPSPAFRRRGRPGSGRRSGPGPTWVTGGRRGRRLTPGRARSPASAAPPSPPEAAAADRHGPSTIALRVHLDVGRAQIAHHPAARQRPRCGRADHVAHHLAGDARVDARGPRRDRWRPAATTSRPPISIRPSNRPSTVRSPAVSIARRSGCLAGSASAARERTLPQLPPLTGRLTRSPGDL